MRTLRTLTARGWAGPAGGRVGYIETPTEYFGTSKQVCGLWPFAAGSSAPTTGVPIGTHLRTGAWVCGDPLSYFTRASLIRTPSAFLFGQPGLGKSTLSRRWLVGAQWAGYRPWVLGDLKPDYVDLIRAMGGQVITLGRGMPAGINPLAGGALAAILPRLGALPDLHRAVAQKVHGRQLQMMRLLIALSRHRPVGGDELTLLSAAIRDLNERTWPHAAVPTVAQLITLLGDGPRPLRAAVLAVDDEPHYRAVADPLRRALAGLLEGQLGDVFAHQHTISFDTAAPAIDVDISAIDGADLDLEAAVLTACWNEGHAAAEAAHILADAGLGPQRNFYLTVDELWRALRGQGEIVDLINDLLRTDRQKGIGELFISHSMGDLDALGSPEARAKARGFVERVGMVGVFGLPAVEFGRLADVLEFSDAERREVISWSAPASLDTATGQLAAPPGRGKLLLKLGNRPGIPLQVRLTATELSTGVHDTNLRWHHRGRTA
jgi:hypothetical protein